MEGDSDGRHFEQKPLAPMTAVRSKQSSSARPREIVQVLCRSGKLCSYEIFTDGSVGDDLSSLFSHFYGHLKAVGST